MKLVISAGRFPDLEVRLATGPTVLRARARRQRGFQYRVGGSTEASALPRFLGSMHEHIAPDSTSRSHVPRHATRPTDRARLRGQRGRDRRPGRALPGGRQFPALPRSPPRLRGNRPAGDACTPEGDPPMTPATSTTPALPTPNSSQSADRVRTTPPDALSLRRLYLLRLGYLFMGGGLAVFKWPAFVAHHGSWPLDEGIVECILLAMSILALLGLRYPVKMLPILLFESLWKLTWLAVVALPKLLGDGLDAATTEHFTNILFVVVILAVIPWGYVVRQYLAAPGDRWR